MEPKFYQCHVCGNVIVKVIDSGVTPSCCGKPMEKLEPHTSEDSVGEKHLPVAMAVHEKTLRVEVGTAPHPMVESHFIQWIYLETDRGGQLVHLHHNDRPAATFCCKGRPMAVYAFCNVHGLWKTELNDLPCEDFYC